MLRALCLLSEADLSRVRNGTAVREGWEVPWETVPPGLSEDARAARQWAGVMHSKTRAHVWPLPPAGAALVFEQEAAKLEQADPGRLTWLMLSKLAQVIGAEA